MPRDIKKSAAYKAFLDSFLYGVGNPGIKWVFYDDLIGGPVKPSGSDWDHATLLAEMGREED